MLSPEVLRLFGGDAALYLVEEGVREVLCHV